MQNLFKDVLLFMEAAHKYSPKFDMYLIYKIHNYNNLILNILSNIPSILS